MLNLSGRKNPKWQLSQAYSHLYYATKLWQLINDEYATYLATLPEDMLPEKLFVFHNWHVRELYDLETKEVKAEVEALQQKSPSLKEAQVTDAMMHEGMSEDAVHMALRKA
jgi:hypothetical protein